MYSDKTHCDSLLRTYLPTNDHELVYWLGRSESVSYQWQTLTNNLNGVVNVLAIDTLKHLYNFHRAYMYDELHMGTRTGVHMGVCVNTYWLTYGCTYACRRYYFYTYCTCICPTPFSAWFSPECTLPQPFVQVHTQSLFLNFCVGL